MRLSLTPVESPHVFTSNFTSTIGKSESVVICAKEYIKFVLSEYNMALEDNQKIGIGLICLGMAFIVLGVIMLLDAS